MENVCVVLVRAPNPSNIGAVARAMYDFGFGQLRVVNAYAVPFETAKSAVDAGEVLANAVACGSVAEAVADCTMVVGTTAVGERELLHDVLPVVEATKKMLAAVSGGGRVALLFGSEKTGLSNEELSHCNFLLTIPMYEREGVRHASMNLGQAVAVCLHELVRDDELVEHDAKAADAVSAGEAERVTELLDEILDKVEYRRHHPANSDVATLRRLVMRMGIEKGDAAIWLGILRQVLWKLGRGSGKTEKNQIE